MKAPVILDMHDATIIKLYKNKGDRSVWTDCNNYLVYRGISLMSIAGKVVARVLLIRLQAMADRSIP